MIDQNPLEREQRARFEDHRQLRYAGYADEKSSDPQYNTVKGCQIRSTSARTTDDDQLMLEDQGFCGHGAHAARTHKPRQGDEQMDP